jgi:uncharacterized protein involved in cysteine biosynthesis
MQNHAITQYHAPGPGIDGLVREIESLLQIYSEIAAAFAVVILVLVVCFLISEIRETGATRSATRRPFNARELTDTGF